MNSANMLIINKEFPIGGLSLVSLFNTKIYNWLFKKIFNTHKVLRSDLETLPIPANFLKSNPNWNEHNLLDYFGVQEHRNGTYTPKT